MAYAMTKKQLYYAKQLRQTIMAAASKQGWDYDYFHDLMVDWGFGNSLRALGINELHELKELLAGQYKPHYTKLMRQMMDHAMSTQGGGLSASYQQVCYICILMGGYCWYSRTRRSEWDAFMRNWLKKYIKKGEAVFLSSEEASKAIYMLETQIVTTFKRTAFTQITGKEYQGKR